jgi:hypothetical protein
MKNIKKFEQFVNESLEEYIIDGERTDGEKEIKKTFTREEVISMLEDVYMETAGSYNDYGKWADDYRDDAISYVKEYMIDK